jgi:hypothetical protein
VGSHDKGCRRPHKLKEALGKYRDINLLPFEREKKADDGLSDICKQSVLPRYEQNSLLGKYTPEQLANVANI